MLLLLLCTVTQARFGCVKGIMDFSQLIVKKDGPAE